MRVPITYSISFPSPIIISLNQPNLLLTPIKPLCTTLNLSHHRHTSHTSATQNLTHKHHSFESNPSLIQKPYYHPHTIATHSLLERAHHINLALSNYNEIENDWENHQYLYPTGQVTSHILLQGQIRWFGVVKQEKRKAEGEVRKASQGTGMWWYGAMELYLYFGVILGFQWLWDEEMGVLVRLNVTGGVLGKVIGEGRGDNYIMPMWNEGLGCEAYWYFAMTVD